MDGVRRWIGADQLSTAKTGGEHHAASGEEDADAGMGAGEGEMLEPGSLEALVKQLLAPSVSAVEQDEYEL